MIVSLLYAHSCKVGHCRWLAALGHARSDAAARINVCCIAGRPTFVHDFIMFFVVNRKQTASYIWDHGDIPKRWEHGDPLPDCGAKQLMLSRLSTHYSTTGRGSRDTRCRHEGCLLRAVGLAGCRLLLRQHPRPCFSFQDRAAAETFRLHRRWIGVLGASARWHRSLHRQGASRFGIGCVLGRGARYETQGSCDLGATGPTAAARGQCYGTCGPPSHRAWRVFVPRAGVCVHPRSWATARFSCALRAGLWAQLL